MKKVFLALILVGIFSSYSFAAGTCTTTSKRFGSIDGIRTTMLMVSVSCTADAADGSYPTYTIEDVGGNLLSVYFNPGATVPTTAMDMVIEMGDTEIDLLGGAGADIDTSADAIITPLMGAVSAPAAFVDDLVIKLTNNSVNSATLTYHIAVQ